MKIEFVKQGSKYIKYKAGSKQKIKEENNLTSEDVIIHYLSDISSNLDYLWDR